MQENNITFLTMGEQGFYMALVPNYDTCEFQAAMFNVRADSVIPFGLPTNIKSQVHLYTRFPGLSKNEVHKKTFEKFVEQLVAVAEKHGAQNVFIRLNTDADLRTHWHIEGEYQLLIQLPTTGVRVT